MSFVASRQEYGEIAEILPIESVALGECRGREIGQSERETDRQTTRARTFRIAADRTFAHHCFDRQADISVGVHAARPGKNGLVDASCNGGFGNDEPAMEAKPKSSVFLRRAHFAREFLIEIRSAGDHIVPNFAADRCPQRFGLGGAILRFRCPHFDERGNAGFAHETHDGNVASIPVDEHGPVGRDTGGDQSFCTLDAVKVAHPLLHLGIAAIGALIVAAASIEDILNRFGISHRFLGCSAAPAQAQRGRQKHAKNHRFHSHSIVPGGLLV